MKKFWVGLVVVTFALVFAGCPAKHGRVGLGGIVVPAGFTEHFSTEGHATYRGSGTIDDALSSFEEAFQDAGWTSAPSLAPGSLTFEKGDKTALLGTARMEGQVYVYVTIIQSPFF